MEEHIGCIVLAMRDYQKQNDIKAQCFTNCQYLYDNLKALNTNNEIEIKPVIAVSKEIIEGIPIIKLISHLVIRIDDVLIDPSFEVFSLSPIYFDSIKEPPITTSGILKTNLKN